MKKKLIKKVSTEFIEYFKKEPEKIFLSPGRINIIGEHIDYNDGFVLPAAINKYICFAVSKNNSNQCKIISKDLKDSYQFNLIDICKPIDKMWMNYILGVIEQLKEKKHKISGFNIVFSSSIPIGAGLSSSAALSCGIAFILNKLFDLKLSKEEIAYLGQKSEHTFVGVNCGIMDQFACVFGKKNKVIKLDCNTLKFKFYDILLKNYSFILFNTNVKHNLLTSEYNVRRAEVEKGLAIIKLNFPEVNNYRDCNINMISEIQDSMSEVLQRRCKYVINEIDRVKNAVEALEDLNYEKLGRLMFETHYGLSKEYEVSCEELDFLVNEVKNEKSVLGARMMGGGFGGCTLNLIEKGEEKDVISRISKKYKEKHNIPLSTYKIKLSKGVSQVKNYIKL